VQGPNPSIAPQSTNCKGSIFFVGVNLYILDQSIISPNKKLSGIIQRVLCGLAERKM
jgi:hypothetical protein